MAQADDALAGGRVGHPVHPGGPAHRACAEAPSQLQPGLHPGHLLHLRGQDHRRILRRRGGGVPDVPRLRADIGVRGEFGKIGIFRKTTTVFPDAIKFTSAPPCVTNAAVLPTS